MAGMRDNYRHDDNAKDRAVELYRSGKPLAMITEETGLSSASVYYELERRGIRPRRQQRREASTLDATALLEQLMAAQREIARLTIELERAGEAAKRRR